MIDVKNKNLTGLKFIDLFAGLGGFRLALESFGAECVYSNEWDKYAKEVNEGTDNKLYPQSSDEVNNLCSYPMDNTCGVCSSVNQNIKYALW